MAKVKTYQPVTKNIASSSIGNYRARIKRYRARIFDLRPPLLLGINPSIVIAVAGRRFYGPVLLHTCIDCSISARDFRELLVLTASLL